MVIVLLDQLVWRPIIAWAEKFKVEQVQDRQAPRSWVLAFSGDQVGLNCFDKKRRHLSARNGRLYLARKPALQAPRHTGSNGKSGWHAP